MMTANMLTRSVCHMPASVVRSCSSRYCRVNCLVSSLCSLTLSTVWPSGYFSLGLMVTCMTGSTAGMRVQTRAVAASCTANLFCLAALYGDLSGPSLSYCNACNINLYVNGLVRSFLCWSMQDVCPVPGMPHLGPCVCRDGRTMACHEKAADEGQEGFARMRGYQRMRQEL